ncbi:tRNA dimethylallyltransferase [Candidatus Saccharibacteria bacterium]|nr:tRNA dimethylallyltransferase [Candidatus Saccharibacteria bacterium]MBR2658341.1 tRNA dimethylallyltransferase [Candidatus Saccharibacteria bacterium]
MCCEEGSVYTGPVIVIVGPTGSGKTGVAIEIAKEISGEIVSADSRATYKYMDIGTAKPSLEERSGVPHFGLDLVEPGERFTVADFKTYAEQKIAEIRARGHVPIVAGGTGLYVDALVYGYQFRGKTGEKAGVDATYEQKSCSDRQKMLPGFEIFGIQWSSDELKKRLAERLNKLFVQELFEETRLLVKKYGNFESQAMKSNIYQFAWGYLQGEYSLEKAKELCLYEDYHLAKRQMTWFRRNNNIKWLPLKQIKQEVIKSQGIFNDFNFIVLK